MTNKELDKFIAEKVMGFPIENGIVLHGCGWQPTTSIVDAFQVVDKIHETWLFSRRQVFLKALQDVISESVFELTDVDQKIAWPDLFFYITPKAVCLAAKKAVDMEGK